MIVMDEPTKSIEDEVLLCRLFAIVLLELVKVTQIGGVNKPEGQTDYLKSKGFGLSRLQIRYLECKCCQGKAETLEERPLAILQY